jgi:hypothetical protein
MALAVVVLPIHAYAQFSGQASATGQFESNTNVFALNSGVAVPGNPNFRRSDTYYLYGAELDGSYLLGRQEFYATANSQEYNYQRNSQLDHNAYNLDAGYRWELSRNVDGQLEATRTHAMVPFYNLTGLASLSLVTVTEQRETAQIGVQLNPNWTVKGSAFTSRADQPTPDAPDLQLTQKSGTASLEYLGHGAITFGLTAGYLSGDYSGANGTIATLNPSFSQTTVGGLANYKYARTSFDGQLGYTRRSSADGADNTSGVTGSLTFTDRLTPKTTFTAKFDRAINSYFLNAGSEIDTDAGIAVDWQATHKLSVNAGYTFTYQNFPGQGNNPVGSDRVDIQESATLGISYKPLHWLLIKPYANVQTRRSTFVGGHFSQNVYGVAFTASTPQRVHKH